MFSGTWPKWAEGDESALEIIRLLELFESIYISVTHVSSSFAIINNFVGKMIFFLVF